MLGFLLLILLPALEIAGFIIIGGEIGVGLSILWVFGSVIAGFYFISTIGTSTLGRARTSVKDDIFPFEEMFESFAILIGALLLFFPGFISDFLAVPLLFPPFRRGLFWILKAQNESVLDGFTKNAQGFSYWYSEKTGSSNNSSTIDGEFTRVDNDSKKLS